MEPISLAASIAGLADAGFSVGKSIYNTYSSYQNAPSVVLEVSHEVNTCCFLMAPLCERLEAGAVKYNDDFKKSIKYLLKNVSVHFSPPRS